MTPIEYNLQKELKKVGLPLEKRIIYPDTCSTSRETIGDIVRRKSVTSDNGIIIYYRVPFGGRCSEHLVKKDSGSRYLELVTDILYGRKFHSEGIKISLKTKESCKDYSEDLQGEIDLLSGNRVWSENIRSNGTLLDHKEEGEILLADINFSTRTRMYETVNKRLDRNFFEGITHPVRHAHELATRITRFAQSYKP